MKFVLNLLLFYCTFVCIGQNELTYEAEKILSKGLSLYRLEMASWQSTDSLTSNDKGSMGGYFSYRNEGVLQSVYYDSSRNFAIKKFQFSEDSRVSVNLVEIYENVPLSGLEKEIILKREKARDMSAVWYGMQGWSEIVNPNIIVVKADSGYEFICIPGAKEHGFTPIGGEVRHKFNSKMEWTGMDHFHNNLIPIEHYEDASIASHNHLGKRLGKEYITPTDICTILLYQKWSNVDRHIVIHKKYISEFYPKDFELVILKNKSRIRMEDVGDYIMNQAKTK